MAEKVEKWEKWERFYSQHSPVMYNELVERWGGEAELWKAYSEGRMERAEEIYFEGPRMFNAAKAFANLVMPAVRRVEDEIKRVSVRVDRIYESLGLTDEAPETAVEPPPNAPAAGVIKGPRKAAEKISNVVLTTAAQEPKP